MARDFNNSLMILNKLKPTCIFLQVDYLFNQE